jgi:hypothetical protein
MTEFDPKVLIEHIDSFAKGLSEWEINFVADMIDHPPERYTEKQLAIIERIYDQKC